MKKVLIIGSQHGNELLGIRLYEHYRDSRPELEEYVTYLCANPRAFARNTRFTETDLNRSYASEQPETYEEKRASWILDYIRTHDFDYILDVHTSTSDVGSIFITPTLDGIPGQIISYSTFDKVAIMPEEIVKQSLIGKCDKSISIEINEQESTQPSVMKDLSELVTNLIKQETQKRPKKRTLYFIERLMLKDDLEEGAENYKALHTGKYPVLIGEKNYVKYIGFLANRIQTTTI